jgi:hypothetical protein
MRSLMRKAELIFVGGLTVVLLAAVPSVASAKPRPGAKPQSGFRLFASILAGLTGNRVYCGINAAKGHICVDTLGSSSVAGGFWPKGTIDQYPFNSGIQVVGTVDASNPGNPWAGDTAGGFFYDPKGTTENGSLVFPVYNSANPADAGNWPAPALVPSPPDPGADDFAPALQGNIKASDNDVWFMTWEGDPASNAGRTHPLGIAVETRGMAFNTPTGNEDVLYFIYTFYNITTTDPAAYGNIRLPMRDTLVGLAKRFQAINAAKFGVQLPTAGYSINDMFVVFGADMDVGDADLDFASVNLPFNLGYAYQYNFAQPSGWVFDPGIFSDPFFPGVGFVGVKYLKSPIDPSTGQQVGLKLYSNTSRSVAFGDANDVFQLYRYAAGRIDPAVGDESCNTGDPLITRICFINRTSPADMRFFQSSGPFTIPAGGSGSVVVAYVFAAPVKTGSCPAPGACQLTPDDPTRLSSTTTLLAGANRIDSVTGYAGFLGDLNANTRVDQAEIRVVPQSLLGKSLIAQTVFDNKFLQPAPPDAPEFFLVPGNNQVTILWRQSPTETNGTGDPYFAAAQGATLYDPNYRQFDVEGYRVYRGRSSSPNDLQLIAQFDYSTTSFIDSTGQANRVNADRTTTCAPEIGVLITCDTTGVGTLNGVRRIVPEAFPIVSPFVQVPTGKYQLLADSSGFVVQSDTAVAGSTSAARLGVVDPGALQLNDTGVPFVYVDRDPSVRNGIRYFYAVAAFDVNSIRSGPSSLESSRIAKPITPQPGASNLVSQSAVTASLEGRGLRLDTVSTVPTLNPTTGVFSAKQQPANNSTLAFVGDFVQSIFATPGSFSAKLIGLGMGDARGGIPSSYSFETTASTGAKDTLTFSVVQPLAADQNATVQAPFPAALADDQLAARFGVPPGFQQSGQLTHGIVAYQLHSGYGRGCVDGAVPIPVDADCAYNGPRWFDGAAETAADPTAGNDPTLGSAPPSFNNAGTLTGIATLQNPMGYVQMSAGLRTVEAIIGSAGRAADLKVYWGAAGKVDSVIDVTHNVVVPFMADSLGGGWGFLNASSATAPGGDGVQGTLTLQDFGCVAPLNDVNRHPDDDFGGQVAGCSYGLSDTAVPGPIVIAGGDETVLGTVAPRPNLGFGMWITGHFFLFELAAGGAVPAANTVWTLREYIGYIEGHPGAYAGFTSSPRTFTAIGAELKVAYDVSNQFVAATEAGLQLAHTVPDPYYVTNAYEQSTENKVIKFVNLPSNAIIRIYSLSGVLVRVLEHHASATSEEVWDVRNRNGQVVGSGVYFFHIEAGGARRVGRMTVVNFAQ